MRPICIDLYCGLGGWSEGFLAEGYTCIGFDIEVHDYGLGRYPGHLCLQDVLTLHGSQFKDAAVIVASPPCQNYSYLAMPWSRSTSNNSQGAKALRRKWETEGPDNRLFDACFRIQREACATAGRYIPLIIENVRGAIPWVGQSRWHYGSFHLWGDVPALMPISRSVKVSGFRFDGSGKSFQSAAVDGIKAGDRCVDRESGKWTTGWNVKNAQDYTAQKNTGGSWFAIQDGKQVPRNDPRYQNNPVSVPGGVKIGGDWFSDPNSTCRKHGSKSNSRKAASAQIAKIPFPLSSHIARCFKPDAGESK